MLKIEDIYLERLNSADSKNVVSRICLMVEPSSQMICHIQILRSRIVVWRGDIKCLDKGRDLQGAIMMDEMIHTTT